MVELRNTLETQIMILKAIAPLKRFVDAEIGVVATKYKGEPLEDQSLWLADIMLRARLIDGNPEIGYSITEAGNELLTNEGGLDNQWQRTVDNWAAQYYLELAERFKDGHPGSSKAIIYQRASANHTFHHNRLNKITE